MMTNTLDSQIDATHTLLAESYAAALVRVARVTLDYSDAVFVRIAHNEIPDDRDPPEDPSDPYESGVQAIQNTWAEVADAFEPADTHIEWGHSANQAARTYRLRESGPALNDLLELTAHRINGAHFVAELLFVSDDQPALYALPHHQHLAVDTTVLDSEAYLAAVADALADRSACLAPCAELTWECEGTRYRLSGASLCIETADAHSSCWRVTRVRRLAVHPTRAELIAEWTPVTERPILGALVRGVTRLSPFPERPERIPCPDRETARHAHDLIAETLRRYDGRSM